MRRTPCSPTGASGGGGIEAARRDQGPRPQPRARRAVVHAIARRPRRRGDQDRAARERRRHAPLGPAVARRGRRARRRLFPQLQPRQEIGGDRFRAARRRGAGPQARRAEPTSSSRISRSAASTKFGLDAASLRAANPRLVYASITGFGQDGPYADRAGYDFIIQGMGGMMSITGLPDGEPGGGPMRVGVAVADLFTGMYTCVAILAALYRRERTRRGRAHRHGAVRHAAGGARQPGVERAGLGQGPAAAGQHPPQYRALPAVRRRRSADHHRGRQRPPVRAAGGDLRASRMGDRRALRDQWRAGRQPRGDRAAGRASAIRRSRPQNGSSSSSERGFRPGRSIASRQALADVQAQHRADGADDRRRAAGRLAGAARRRARRLPTCRRRRSASIRRGARRPRARRRRRSSGSRPPGVVG